MMSLSQNQPDFGTGFDKNFLKRGVECEKAFWRDNRHDHAI
jgi:hypothetical protein